MQQIGFIGLGHMGHPMALNLIRAGYSVIVFDINQTAVDSLISEGAKAADSVIDIARQADLVFTMLQTGEQVESICIGDNGIFSALQKDEIGRAHV